MSHQRHGGYGRRGTRFQEGYSLVTTRIEASYYPRIVNGRIRIIVLALKSTRVAVTCSQDLNIECLLHSCTPIRWPFEFKVRWTGGNIVLRGSDFLHLKALSHNDSTDEINRHSRSKGHCFPYSFKRQQSTFPASLWAGPVQHKAHSSRHDERRLSMSRQPFVLAQRVDPLSGCHDAFQAWTRLCSKPLQEVR